jgi:hypothetical protein
MKNSNGALDGGDLYSSRVPDTKAVHSITFTFRQESKVRS